MLQKKLKRFIQFSPYIGLEKHLGGKGKNQKLEMEFSNFVSHVQFDESLEPEENQSALEIPAETLPTAEESPEISSIKDSDPKEIVQIISPAETSMTVRINEISSNKNKRRGPLKYTSIVKDFVLRSCFVFEC